MTSNQSQDAPCVMQVVCTAELPFAMPKEDEIVFIVHNDDGSVGVMRCREQPGPIPIPVVVL